VSIAEAVAPDGRTGQQLFKGLRERRAIEGDVMVQNSLETLIQRYLNHQAEERHLAAQPPSATVQGEKRWLAWQGGQWVSQVVARLEEPVAHRGAQEALLAWWWR
jgi:hypothetical protein